MLRTLFIALLLPLALHAQENSQSRWPKQYTSNEYPRLDIVVLSSPGIRQRCNNAIITTDSISCGKNKKAHAYGRDDIAAIIAAPSHALLRDQLIMVAASAAILASSFFVLIVPSIILRVLTGNVLWLAAFGDNRIDHSSDILLYQRSNTTLNIKLHA